MKKNQYFYILILFIYLILSSGISCTQKTILQTKDRPNFIIIFTDDQGFGDLSSFGSKKIKTPHIDRMAREGRKFTNFMVTSPVCTPSRASLLTGAYPKRISLHKHVLFPYSKHGLNPNEHTIADYLKSQGYSTACFGKWHLGHHKETLPLRHGFDTYFGIPYSNDMNHPNNKGKKRMTIKYLDSLWKNPKSTITNWNTPLIENEQIIELPVDQRTITRRYTNKAIDFIKKNQKKNFFIYLPHSMPHIPLYVPNEEHNTNPRNAYIRTIEHIDAEVGRLLDTLRKLGLDKNTYVIFTSDNGPWTSFKHHGGSAGPLRGGKGTTFEGGQRVPFIVWAPGHIPANTSSSELLTTLDILPTIMSLTKIPLHKDKKIDGFDASKLLLNNKEKSPRKEFLYYNSQGFLEGIRQGKWKLLKKKKKPQIMLFDLSLDIREKHNLAKAKPNRVKSLMSRMHKLDAEIAKNARPAWRKKK